LIIVRFRYVCFFATTVLFSMGAPAKDDSIVPANKDPGQVESKALRLMHDLKKQGFEVNRGYFKLWSIEDCQYTIDRMGLCYGNNPAALNITFAVPPWPKKFVGSKSIFGGTSAPGYIDKYLTDDHCYEIPETTIPPGDQFLLTIRDYIVPDTLRGPDSSLILPAMVLELKRP